MQIQVRMLLRMAVKQGSIEAHTETAAEMVKCKRREYRGREYREQQHRRNG